MIPSPRSTARTTLIAAAVAVLALGIADGNHQGAPVAVVPVHAASQEGPSAT